MKHLTDDLKNQISKVLEEYVFELNTSDVRKHIKKRLEKITKDILKDNSTSEHISGGCMLFESDKIKIFIEPGNISICLN